MANDATRVGILSALLDEAGVPIDGISVSDVNATPVAFTINYKSSATAEQIALGDQIGAAFDWKKRRLLPRATVVAGLNQLTNAEQNAAIRHLVIEFARANPTIAARLFAALGLAITVDEVDPT